MQLRNVMGHSLLQKPVAVVYVAHFVRVITVYSENVEITYTLQPMTSLWRHICKRL